MNSLDKQAIVIVDADGTIRLWNQGATDLFGYAAEEAVGRPVDLIIPSEHRAEHWAGFRAAMKSGVAKYANQVMDLPVLPRSGTAVALKVQLSFLKDAGGQAIGAMAVLERPGS
jgi:PAS domain S-box-containing protein